MSKLLNGAPILERNYNIVISASLTLHVGYPSLESTSRFIMFDNDKCQYPCSPSKSVSHFGAFLAGIIGVFYE